MEYQKYIALNTNLGANRELFLLLGKAIRNDILEKAKATNSYGFLVNEATENVLEKSTSANADTLVKLITREIKANDLNINKLSSFASSGARVMTSSQNGVAAKLREVIPTLDLACNDALRCITEVETVLCHLWRFFKNSAQDLQCTSKLLLK